MLIWRSSSNPKSQDAKFLKGVAARMLGDVKTAERCLEDITCRVAGELSSFEPIRPSAWPSKTTKKSASARCRSPRSTSACMDKIGRMPSQAIESAATLGWVYVSNAAHHRSHAGVANRRQFRRPLDPTVCILWPA